MNAAAAYITEILEDRTGQIDPWQLKSERLGLLEPLMGALRMHWKD
jgi:hypothetical protein